MCNTKWKMKSNSIEWRTANHKMSPPPPPLCLRVLCFTVYTELYICMSIFHIYVFVFAYGQRTHTFPLHPLRQMDLTHILIAWNHLKLHKIPNCKYGTQAVFLYSGHSKWISFLSLINLFSHLLHNPIRTHSSPFVSWKLVIDRRICNQFVF